MNIPDSVLNEYCPICGGEYEWCGLDAHTDEDGRVFVDWHPHCQDLLDAVGSRGWEAVWGMKLEDQLEVAIGLSGVRQVYAEYSDSLCRFALAAKVPGTGVKGWQSEVFRDIDEYHSHHNAPQGWKFGVAVYNGRAKVGVAVVGRPVSRMIQTNEPGTLEVTRVCCFGDPRLRRNAASKLYSLCAKEARKLGATKLITYTLEEEDAASLKAANWTPVATSGGGSWSRPSRGRRDKAPTCKKTRWELVLVRQKKARKAA